MNREIVQYLRDRISDLGLQVEDSPNIFDPNVQSPTPTIKLGGVPYRASTPEEIDTILKEILWKFPSRVVIYHPKDLVEAVLFSLEIKIDFSISWAHEFLKINFEEYGLYVHHEKKSVTQDHFSFQEVFRDVSSSLWYYFLKDFDLHLPTEGKFYEFKDGLLTWTGIPIITDLEIK